MRGRGNHCPVRLSELNLHLNFDDFVMRFVVDSRALGTVIGLPAGVLDEKREGREESDRSNMRPGFGRRKQFRVLIQESVHRFIAPLTQEVRLAHSLVGKRCVVSERRWAQKQTSSESRGAILEG